MTFRPRGSPRWRGGMKRVGDHETGGAFYLHGTKNDRWWRIGGGFRGTSSKHFEFARSLIARMIATERRRAWLVQLRRLLVEPMERRWRYCPGKAVILTDVRDQIARPRNGLNSNRSKKKAPRRRRGDFHFSSAPALKFLRRSRCRRRSGPPRRRPRLPPVRGRCRRPPRRRRSRRHRRFRPHRPCSRSPRPR